MNKVLQDFIQKCADELAEPDDIIRMLAENDEAAKHYCAAIDMLLAGAVQTLAGNVYRVPILAPSVCDTLVEVAKDYPFSVNEMEDDDYRINEVVMRNVDPAGYGVLSELLMPILDAYCLLIFSKHLSHFASLQFARYTIDGTRSTKFHHDVESDFTCVISLNPENFTGGGTGIRKAPHLEVNLEPLPKGYGLVFNGKAVHHRGLPVESGERLLLVCWCSTEEPASSADESEPQSQEASHLEAEHPAEAPPASQGLAEASHP